MQKDFASRSFATSRYSSHMSYSSNQQPSERTPLLSEQQQAPTQTQAPKQASGSWKVYLVISGIFAFLGIWSFCLRSTLPEALTDEKADVSNTFAGQHAFDEYLSVLTEPRAGSSKANRAHREWLLHTVREESNKYSVSVEIDEDGVQFVDKGYLGGDYWMVESNNVLVKVIGTRGDEVAYLLSAHYGWYFSYVQLISCV
jgi:hypothetical protein